VRGIDSRPFYTLTVFVGRLRRGTTDLDHRKSDHSKSYAFGNRPRLGTAGPIETQFCCPGLFIVTTIGAWVRRPASTASACFSGGSAHIVTPHSLSRFGLKMPSFFGFTSAVFGLRTGCMGNSCHFSTVFVLDFRRPLPQATCYLHVSVTTGSALVSQNLNGHDTVSRRLTGSGALR
jgi:hypothetical protein